MTREYAGGGVALGKWKTVCFFESYDERPQ